jgi:hypothetical protein
VAGTLVMIGDVAIRIISMASDAPITRFQAVRL